MSKSFPTIRQVGDADYEALAMFLEENNRAETTRHFHPFPLTSQTAYRIARTSHLDRYYVAVWEGRIVGLCMLRGWDEGYSVPSLGILVDRHYHGQGIGTRMLEFTMREARKLGCRCIRLSVYASNCAALSLYASMGFFEGTREPVLVAGDSDEKIIMFRDLEHPDERAN
jgi:ribosomal-protein-alanine N-acetyltransferase